MKYAIIKIALTVLMLLISPIAMAIPDSNSIVRDGIEYYIQTDKSVYNLGEDVEMLYRVTNLTDVNVTFRFPSSPAWNFWVEKDGEGIWSAVKIWYAFGTSFTLTPSEYKEFPDFSPPYVWDMRDDEGNLINVGEYEVIGGFDAGIAENFYYSRVSVPITVVPEPGSFVLLLGGMFYLTRKRKT
jgi:hypothetical protein